MGALRCLLGKFWGATWLGLSLPLLRRQCLRRLGYEEFTIRPNLRPRQQKLPRQLLRLLHSLRLSLQTILPRPLQPVLSHLRGVKL